MRAINDGNVLPFRIDYINIVKSKDDAKDKNVSAIDIERVLGALECIMEIAKYILDYFDQKARRNSYDSLNDQRLTGFNSILAISSIPMAMKYYSEFKKQLVKIGRKMTVATIFSYSANEENPEDTLPDKDFNTDGLDQTSRDFLESAIKD